MTEPRGDDSGGEMEGVIEVVVSEIYLDKGLGKKKPHLVQLQWGGKSCGEGEVPKT